MEVRQLYSALRPDPWRASNPFTADMVEANAAMLGASPSEAIEILSVWLQRFQPCLFGRIAARQGLLAFCLLDEADLNEPDDVICDRIQRARLEWTAAGFRGQKSGFIIVVRSERIISACPDPAMLAFAQKVASLYLLEEVVPGQVHLDELFLEVPGRTARAFRWQAGVNYFSAQGDGRWWHDHRIPGGMAFSVNSVGHMVKSGILARAMATLDDTLGLEAEDARLSPIDSLPKALEWAMRTIGLAAETPSGRATELLPKDRDVGPRCPVPLPGFLADKNHCEYRGWYHTDETLPLDYFDPAVMRPASKEQRRLDFTYLFHDTVDNPDHKRLGQGVRVRGGDVSGTAGRMGRVDETIVEVSRSARLREALGVRPTSPGDSGAS